MAKYLTRRPHPGAVKYLFCLLTAAALITLFSRSSFLYPFNNWSDTNVYMTMGREMLRGAVPYKDLFDHKGLLWYFLYALANLVSTSSYMGLYLIEIFSFSIFLYYSAKTLELFLPPVWAAVCIPALGCLIAVSDAFGMGGSAEEIHLSFASAGIYFLTRLIQSGQKGAGLQDAPVRKYDPLPYSAVFACGLLAGCVLWIKYSMLGFWFGWMMFVFFLLVCQKKWRRALASCALFLLGMAAVSLPCLVYLLATGSLGDFLHVYLEINLRYASVGEAGSLTERLANSLHYYLMMYGWNKILGTLTLAGLAASLIFPVISRNFLKWLILPAIYLLAVGTAYMGKVSHFYYFLITGPFLITAFLTAGWTVQTVLSWGRRPAHSEILPVEPAQDRPDSPVRSHPVLRKAGTAALCLLSLAASCLYGWTRSPNIFFMDYEKEDLTQYQAAALMEGTESPTLMYYANIIDTGILMASEDARPWGKYFFMPNISYDAYPEIRDSQEAGLRSREADFVLTYQYGTESLRQNYHLVRYFPSSEKDRGDSYLFMQANDYDLYTCSKLDFSGDGSFSYTLGDIDWTEEGDENAFVLIGRLRQTVTAQNVTVVAPKDGNPELYLYVSEDGENWLPAESRTEFDEITLNFEPAAVNYIKIVRARNLGMEGVWQVRVYEPSGSCQQAQNHSSAIQALSAGLNPAAAPADSAGSSSHTGAAGPDTASLPHLTDHDVTLGWDSGISQTEGMYLEVSLAQTCSIRKIGLKTFENLVSSPDQIILEYENEKGETISLSCTADQNTLQPEQPVQTSRFRLILTGGQEESWHIDELEIYGAAG